MSDSVHACVIEHLTGSTARQLHHGTVVTDVLLLQSQVSDAAATVASVGIVNGDSLTVREKPAPPQAAASTPSAAAAPTHHNASSADAAANLVSTSSQACILTWHLCLATLLAGNLP
jgi:hypothetical protein